MAVPGTSPKPKPGEAVPERERERGMNILFDSEKLRRLIMSLYELTGIQTNIYDTQGRDIRLFGKHSAFCSIMNRSPEGHARCESCDREAVRRCAEKGRPHTYRCHAGLWEVILPIFDSGEIIAFLSFGQMLDDSPRKLQWENTRRSLGWYRGDFAELWDAYQLLDRHSPARREAYAEILEAVTAYIRLEGMIRSVHFSDQQRLEMYLDEHYAEKLSLGKIASDLGIGTTKLCALARRLSGDGSVTRLIAVRRVEAAKLLLVREPLSVAQIAGKVGFSDYNYFTRIFKQLVGETPSQYRRHADEHAL